MPDFQPFDPLPPLSLYVHIPWCVRKCPYCDFNSHQAEADLPVDEYLNAIALDLAQDASLAQGRKIQTVFFGGGTPSLLPASAIARILETAEHSIGLSRQCEITLEANPGTAEYDNFSGYINAGVNRLSMGVQSFDADKLQRLGRIHSPDDVHRAFKLARDAGFDNINLDLMFALPEQTPEQAMDDLRQAIALEPEHLSWYQLTIEPNTEFYSRPPQQPEDDSIWQTQQQGQSLLAEAGFQQYEISAYARQGQRAAHNLNYWQFGDYLATGAGAHGKITLKQPRQILRYRKTRLPRHYMAAATITDDNTNPFNADLHIVTNEALPFEFMMNALRLVEGVPSDLYAARTGMALSSIEPTLSQQHKRGLLSSYNNRLQASPQGLLYLNNLLESFL
ncbi:radical SAM family heme chaperone HemW [Teredinibacter haidensis]|uniref:radical SAM family heme chaperone HemW n=1 Tax=Teredinibacter haidensis TaxID=2731755 RepID=UPI000948939D|nr:radical SAM family heme chaperone HemW [Teredinibacter haidensis]